VKLAGALRNRNYRLFFAGQGLSLIGTWLTRFAMGFATYKLGGTAWQLGLVAFFSQAPTSIIAPVAGVLVDRWDRHRVIVITQIFAMLQSAALAVFALTGWMTVWHLMWLGAMQAVINAFDMPARQSFVRQMVADRADLPNAIALNSALVNGARMVGPVIATVLCAAVGFGWCFAIDAMSYLAVIGSLLAMRVVKAPRRVRTSHVREELLEGLRYVNGYPFVRSLLILLGITCVFGGAYTALLPQIADASLHGGDHGLGWLLGSAGAGALCGALYLAARRGTAGLEHVIAKCGISMGIGLVALELAPGIWAAVPMMFLVGLGLMVQWTSTNTLVQTLVDDDKLGRVMSLYAVAFFTGAPLGALIEGAVATVIGPIHTYALAGVGCLAASLWYRRRLPPHVAS